MDKLNLAVNILTIVADIAVIGIILKGWKK